MLPAAETLGGNSPILPIRVHLAAAHLIRKERGNMITWVTVLVFSWFVWIVFSAVMSVKIHKDLRDIRDSVQASRKA
jgi:hypothetical protein